ncbi:Na+/H+ antiporter NhaA [Labedaea rhizosphaerae]|uniref:Na+/H+ antiporter NhaA n=1 Tax=Labedaea rhizosphaerae TaxID=598644 RepID=UPI0010620C70|nr:Na+/H+ antiporter NhaA [Labedaea rhizosphaerae]
MARQPVTRRPVTEFARYLRTETAGGIALLVATAVALVWANSPLAEHYDQLRNLRVGPPALHLDLSLGSWAADGLLALFFFVAGLELKRELVVGELSSVRAALLPAIAALGGMVVPAVVAAGIAGGGKTWAIPVATDIAFALGVLAVCGRRMPSGARLFLLSLAVVDDLGAILVIAVLFTTGFSVLAAALAVVLLGLYAFLQHKRVRTPWLYVPLALATWITVHESGIHATVAGIALGLLTRARPDAGEPESPCLRLEHRLQPWSAGFAVPLFALFAAGVSIGGHELGAIFTSGLGLAVLIGLVVGKLIGIFGAVFVAVRLRVAALPAGLRLPDVLAVAALGGVGFTVSLLIAELALPPELAESAKAAVLVASTIAALLAAGLLVRRGRRHEQG